MISLAHSISTRLSFLRTVCHPPDSITLFKRSAKRAVVNRVISQASNRSRQQIHSDQGKRKSLLCLPGEYLKQQHSHQSNSSLTNNRGHQHWQQHQLFVQPLLTFPAAPPSRLCTLQVRAASRFVVAATGGFGQPIKKKRDKVVYVCDQCGNESKQWWGDCSACGALGSLKRFTVTDDEPGSGGGGGGPAIRAFERSRGNAGSLGGREDPKRRRADGASRNGSSGGSGNSSSSGSSGTGSSGVRRAYPRTDAGGVSGTGGHITGGRSTGSMRPGAVHQQPDEEEDGEEEEEDGEEGEEREEGEGNSEQYSRTRRSRGSGFGGWVNNNGRSGSGYSSSSSSSSSGYGSSSSLLLSSSRPRARPLQEVIESAGDSWHLSLKGPEGEEICRVLGGGVVLGSLVLVSGSPGAGKSTLLLQLAGLLAEEARGSLTGGSPLAVLYVSGEEREEQLATRAKRLGITADNLFLLSENNLESILEGITEIEPRAVIVDSIQTMHLPGVTGSLGSVSQVRECTLLLLLEAKNRGIPIFIVGHVTKAGDVAGPRDLKHIVDVVMHVESDRQDSHRILSTSKNRFGSTDEVGVFEMAAQGMVAVPNPSLAFLPASRTRGSAAVAVVMHGSRPLLLEVQALCVKAIPNIPPTKTANGVDMYRLTILTKIMRHIGLPIGSKDVVVNVVGGMQVKEPAADLAIAVAIASSLYESPVPADTAFIGEIGLNGELRGVIQLDRRVNEVAKLGFSRCVVPAKQWKGQAAPSGCEVVKCEGLRDALKAVGIQSTGYGGKRKVKEEEIDEDEDYL